MRHTLEHVGPAMVSTRIVLVLGFGVLTLSHFRMTSHLGWLIARLPEPAPLVESLTPRLRVLVWAASELLPPTMDYALATLAELGDAAKPLGSEVGRIAAASGYTKLHAAALALDGAPVNSFIAISKANPEELDDLIRRHFDRFAEANLEVLLHHALTFEREPLIERCLAAAAERLGPEVPGLVSNAIYAQTQAGNAHVSIRIARDFVTRYRARHRDRLLATLYTNILLVYGTARRDDTVRVVTEELEEILRDDPSYFASETRPPTPGRQGRV
jgi:hypothetical protein